MSAPRVGFVTGIESFWRHQLLVAKYRAQRLSGVYTPDVYALPRFLTDQHELIRNGQKIGPSEYDLVFSELNGSDSQLEYLDHLVMAKNPPVAVVPGPPEIICGSLTNRKLQLVRRILLNARYVFAYSKAIATFYDGLIGASRAQVIPWPFDYQGVRRLGGDSLPADSSKTLRIVLNVPLNFVGITRNYPFVLKSVASEILSELPASDRSRLSFHTFVYSAADRAEFTRSGFGDGIPLVLEEKMRFSSFIRFVGNCDGIINLTSPNILGRITFIAAVLEKPGIFTAPVQLNEDLYPDGALVSLLDPDCLRREMRDMLIGLLRNQIDPRFLPNIAAAKRLGDFSANARTFAGLLAA